MSVLYEFIVFDPSGRLVYYEDIQKTFNPATAKLTPAQIEAEEKAMIEDIEFQHRIKNMFGIIFTLKSLVQKLSVAPVNTFRYFVTTKYKLSIFESATNMKFILLSAVDEIDYSVLLRQVYADAYVEYVKKNIFYNQGDKITCPAFQAKVREMFSETISGKKP